MTCLKAFLARRFRWAQDRSGLAESTPWLARKEEMFPPGRGDYPQASRPHGLPRPVKRHSGTAHGPPPRIIDCSEQSIHRRSRGGDEIEQHRVTATRSTYKCRRDLTSATNCFPSRPHAREPGEAAHFGPVAEPGPEPRVSTYQSSHSSD